MNRNYRYRVNHVFYDGNQSNSKADREAWNQFLVELQKRGHDYFLTLVFNQDRSIESVRRSARHLFARINREHFGPRWIKREDRWRAVGFIENVGSNIHMHLLVYCASDPRLIDESFTKAVLSRHWRALCPTGSIDMQRVNGTPEKLAGYLTKNYRRGALSGAEFM